MDFYDALREVAAGKKVRRQSWPADAVIFLFAGVIHLRNADGSMHTLLVSDGDLAGADWTVVREQ